MMWFIIDPENSWVFPIILTIYKLYANKGQQNHHQYGKKSGMLHKVFEF